MLDFNLQLGKKGFLTEWILLISGLIVLGGFITFWLVSGKQATLEREYSRLNSQTQLIHSSLERQVKALHFAHLNIKEEVLDGLVTATDRSEFIKKRLDAFTEILPLAKNIKLVDINQQLAITSHNAAQELSAEEIKLFNQLSKKPITSGFYLTEVMHKNKPNIYLANQLATPDGKFYGLLITQLSTEHMAALLENVFYADDTRALLINTDGLVFAAASKDMKLQGINILKLYNQPVEIAESPMIASKILTTKDMFVSNQYRLVALHKFLPADLQPDKQLSIAFSREYSAVMENFHRLAMPLMLLYGIIVIFSVPLLYLMQIKRKERLKQIQLAEEALVINNQQLESLNAKLIRQSHQLELLAFQDGLTGIANRRLLDEKLDAAWQTCLEAQQPLAFIMLDIDYFKKYNDHYGHQQGDVCLRKVAAKLAEKFMWPEGKLARFGGEEFACLLPNASLEEAVKVAEKLRQAVASLRLEHINSDVINYVTLSLGAASFVPTEDKRLADLVEAADAALYQAKAAGRNQVAS